jgi:hypothetical protein
MAGPNANSGEILRPPSQTEATVSKIPHLLPHERVFPIQIGSELFKLSGASISSDGECPHRNPSPKPRTHWTSRNMKQTVKPFVLKSLAECDIS